MSAPGPVGVYDSRNVRPSTARRAASRTVTTSASIKGRDWLITSRGGGFSTCPWASPALTTHAATTHAWCSLIHCLPDDRHPMSCPPGVKHTAVGRRAPQTGVSLLSQPRDQGRQGFDVSEGRVEVHDAGSQHEP